jgi:hypothetical protein
MYKENAELLLLKIKETDQVLIELKSVFKSISKNHKTSGRHIEYVYLENFLNESEDVSYMFQFLFSNQRTKKFLPVASRMLFEVLLKNEYLIRLKNKGNDKDVLSLLSRDMASVMSALDEAVDSEERNPVSETLVSLGMINKLLGTDFDLSKIKSNTKTFPTIKDLCCESSICIRDYCGDNLYHYYVQWSWNNHSRLGNNFHLEKSLEYSVNIEVESFLEMYLKNIKLLSKHAKASTCEEKVLKIMEEIGVQNF